MSNSPGRDGALALQLQVTCVSIVEITHYPLTSWSTVLSTTFWWEHSINKSEITTMANQPIIYIKITVKFSREQLASCCFCISHELNLWGREGEKTKPFHCLTRQKTIAALEVDLLTDVLSEVLSTPELSSVAKPMTPKSTQKLPKLLVATLSSLD